MTLVNDKWDVACDWLIYQRRGLRLVDLPKTKLVIGWPTRDEACHWLTYQRRGLELTALREMRPVIGWTTGDDACDWLTYHRRSLWLANLPETRPAIGWPTWEDDCDWLSPRRLMGVLPGVSRVTSSWMLLYTARMYPATTIWTIEPHSWSRGILFP